MNSIQKEIRWHLNAIEETLTSMHSQKWRFTPSEFMEVDRRRNQALEWLLEAQLKEFDRGRQTVGSRPPKRHPV